MSESPVKLLNSPYGEVAYEDFRRLNRAFADKSGIIEFLDSDGMTLYPVLLRPRRFGKSTFVHMLKCFYDISYGDRYEELFSGTSIYGKNLERHNTYHVVNFDFSGIYGKDLDNLIDDFNGAIESGILDFMGRYPDFVFNPSDNDRKSPSVFIKAFFNSFKKYSGRKSLYVMIDEYDHFANELLSENMEMFRTITRSQGFLKSFYANIKAYASSLVAKTFITGVSSVSLDSLTSGFNISLNVTSRECFNNYAGLTEDELKKIIPQLVDLKKIGATADEIISRMKPVYDGYCFSRQAKNTVFNSSMCLYYLNEMSCANALISPEDYLDPASDHDGSKLRQLFVMAEDDLADKVINGYLEGKTFYTPKLAQNINLNSATNKTDRYDENQLLSMLYYLGYLTIDPDLSKNDRLALKIPNLFMSKLFAGCAVDLKLKSNRLFRKQGLDVSSLLAVSDDISSFARSCTEFLSSIFTNQVLFHMSEMALNLVLHAKLVSTSDVYAEMQKSIRIPAAGEKYADLVVTVNDGTENECVYLMELKYAAKKEATDSKIESLKKEATEQARSYRSALEFKGRRIKAYAMIFSGPECVCCAQA
ncbi:MAG: AAA family ATPase [Succinivibrionaceae bacterium]|nr:AAA family ATPase [Succinivibrionaceae bacterium]